MFPRQIWFVQGQTKVVDHFDFTGFIKSYQSIGVEWHNYSSHTEISHSQGHYEVVCDVLEGALLGYGENNQHIAEYHGYAEDKQEESRVVHGGGLLRTF